MHNVVAFETAEELLHKLAHIEQNGLYPHLQRNTFQWVQQHTCECMARHLLLDLDGATPERHDAQPADSEP